MVITAGRAVFFIGHGRFLFRGSEYAIATFERVFQCAPLIRKDGNKYVDYKLMTEVMER